METQILKTLQRLVGMEVCGCPWPQTKFSWSWFQQQQHKLSEVLIYKDQSCELIFFVELAADSPYCVPVPGYHILYSPIFLM